MSDLTQSFANYIKQAKLYMGANEFNKAHESILHAAECSLLLAKSSTGKQRTVYLEQYNSCKALLQNLASKINAQKESGSGESNNAGNTPAESKSPSSGTDFGSGSDKKDYNRNYNKDGRKDGNDGADKPEKEWNNTPKVRQSNPLSPQWLSDYIGQPKAVTAVKDLITAALLKNSALPHLILYGSHGLGKTTFANIIANELHVGFTEVNVSKINPTEMIAILKKIKPRDIVFIDEIHTLPLPVAESVLYSAMQDGRITYNEGKGKFAKTVELNLPPFTLIGATTEIGKLAKPFTQRAIQIRLEEYTDEVLSGIITNSFYRLGMKINGENALYIAVRCRNNPRIANSMVRRISDKALVRYAAMNNVKASGSFNSVEAIKKLNIEVSRKVIDEFFEENGIDEYGLENGDRELLKIIINRYNGGPVGLDTLAKVLNESNNVISQKYEAYLIKKGLLRIDRDGRVVMPDGYKVLGLPVPAHLLEDDSKKNDDNAGNGDSGDDAKKTKYETRKLIASHVPNELKCAKIEELIVYPESARVFEEPLDELFPDIEKNYDEETKHRCTLEIDFDDFKRTVVCDSFLESRFASCMASVGFLKDIKAQALELPYISQELANRRYFPDFVIKDYKGRIAVIEMKNFEMMSYHLNIDKYEMLKQYCERQGFGYSEIMKAMNADSYVSVEMLMNAPVNTQLEQYITETIEKNGNETGEGAFTEKDFEKYNELYGNTPKTDVYTILLNNRRLKNIDRVGNAMKIVCN